ncbi:hypothetical protein ABFX02_09G118300 [Erythranthe guttata]
MCDRMVMKKHKADPNTRNPRGGGKRQQESEIDKLPDDLLIAIVSRMSIKDAIGTSILSRRWRYLWTFAYGLRFDDKECTDRNRFNFIRLVDRVFKLHQGKSVDSLILRFFNKCKSPYFYPIGKWIDFALHKEVKRFELDLSGASCNHEFPCLFMLLTRFPIDKVLPLFDTLNVRDSLPRYLRSLNAFISLRSFRLVNVAIKDEMVQYFLASCQYIEKICIRGSNATKDLEFVDPLPYLKVLEISECCNIQSLVISVVNLVSCTYEGRKIGLPFKKVPSLSELTLGGGFCGSFVYEPNKHSSYSAQLVKLVLNIPHVSALSVIVPRELPQLYALKRMELSVMSHVGRSLLFWTSLIEASPQLQELKIKIIYLLRCSSSTIGWNLLPFPEVTSAEANMFDHKNLKVIEMGGYCGCAREDEFLVHVCKSAAMSLETVIIDTDCSYYCDPECSSFFVMYKLRVDGKVPMVNEGGTTRREEPIEYGDLNQFDAKKHAERFTSSFRSSEIKFVIR